MNFRAATLLTLLFLSSFQAQQPSPLHVRGRVLSRDGKPIEKVKVIGAEGPCCPFKRPTVETGPDGSFELDDPKPVLYFSHEKYRPAARLIEGLNSEIVLTMDAASESNWVIPECSSVHGKQKRVGGEWSRWLALRFAVPPKTAVKSGSDVDYFSVSILSPDKQHQMLIFSGPTAGGTAPNDPDYLEAASFQRRWIVAGQGIVGLDQSGVTREGKHWRQAGIFQTEAAFYSKLDEANAVFFDSVFKSACYSTGNGKK